MKLLKLLVLYFVSLFFFLTSVKTERSNNFNKEKPNIIFFLTDDWGFNDVGYNGNTDTETPFIDKIAQNDGLIIDKYYTMHLCTISRAALLTGRYPFRYGLQTSVLTYESNYALSAQETLLSQEFKAHGYSTHLIGKWHLGMMNWAYTPTYRGFDTFYGYYGGALYYNEHQGWDFFSTGLDLRDGVKPFEDPEIYSLYLWANKANKLFESKVNEKEENEEIDPFFLYLAWQGSHAPSQAPDSYVDIYRRKLNKFPTITTDDQGNLVLNDTRLAFQAQTTMTDVLFKSMVLNLKSSGLWDNTLLIFASDNGGANGYGDVAPLRGGKGAIWDGGLRVPAFITGGYLPENLRGKTFDSYPVHVTDWYHTLLAACGLNPTVTNKDLDGKNVWNLLNTASKLSSDRFPNNENINEEIQTIHRDQSQDATDSNTNSIQTNDYITNDMLDITDERIIVLNVNNNSCSNEACGAVLLGGRWKLILSDNELWGLDAECNWYRQDTPSTNDILGCGEVPEDVNITECNCRTSACLFDLLNDPCEYYDVSNENEYITNTLYNVLVEYHTNRQMEPLASLIGEDHNKSGVVDAREYANNANGLISNSASNNNGSVFMFWGPWDNKDDWRDLKFEKEINFHIDAVRRHDIQTKEVHRIDWMSMRNNNNNDDNDDNNEEQSVYDNSNDVNRLGEVKQHEHGHEEPMRIVVGESSHDKDESTQKSDSNKHVKNTGNNNKSIYTFVWVVIGGSGGIICLLYLYVYFQEHSKQTIYKFHVNLACDDEERVPLPIKRNDNNDSLSRMFVPPI